MAIVLLLVTYYLYASCIQNTLILWAHSPKVSFLHHSSPWLRFQTFAIYIRYEWDTFYLISSIASQVHFLLVGDLRLDISYLLLTHLSYSEIKKEGNGRHAHSLIHSSSEMSQIHISIFCDWFFLILPFGLLVLLWVTFCCLFFNKTVCASKWPFSAYFLPVRSQGSKNLYHS